MGGGTAADGHDRGLEQDLARIARQRQARRQALQILLAGGASLLTVRGIAADAACEAAPRETAGPFPADGSNSVRGANVNVLNRSGILRSDIRSSFGGSANRAQGVELELVVTLQDARRGCAPLPAHAIYVWHADRDGDYSLYQGKAIDENYLRGVQLTDERGQVRFTTVYPSCYGGRYPHIHFEVYAGETVVSNRKLTSQIVMPANHSTEVYARATGYARSRENFARMSSATDGVFRNNTPAQIAAMTPRLRGDPQSAYAGELAIAI